MQPPQNGFCFKTNISACGKEFLHKEHWAILSAAALAPGAPAPVEGVGFGRCGCDPERGVPAEAAAEEFWTGEGADDPVLGVVPVTPDVGVLAGPGLAGFGLAPPVG